MADEAETTTIEYEETAIEYAVRLFAEQGVPEHVTLAIMKAESGLNETAHNPEAHRNWRTGEVICYGSFGLFQIGCVNYLENPTKLYDPYFNVDIAVQVLKSQGLKAWGAYTDNRYLQYL